MKREHNAFDTCERIVPIAMIPIHLALIRVPVDRTTGSTCIDCEVKRLDKTSKNIHRDAIPEKPELWS